MDALEGAAVGVGYALLGLGLLLSAILPRALKRVPLSPAMIFVGAGLLPALLPDAPQLLPTEHPAAVERVTELCVIVSLMGVGLAIERPFTIPGWSSTWRLLLVAMPVFIGLTALLGSTLGFTAATALLIGAICAPTDPVLASDVRVGKPNNDPEGEDDLRFALSSEAGANDGAAFPFVHAGLLLTAAPASQWLAGWVAWELLGKTVIGLACGVMVGYLFAFLAFRFPVPALRFADTAEAIVALSTVFLAYGIAEIVGGYGFVSVFAAAVAFRSQEREHEFHATLHDFTTQVERLLTLGVLLLFGYSIGSGLLAHLTWQGALLGVLAVLVIRPLSGMLALFRAPMAALDMRGIAFFGVKGIGSFYYLAFASSHATLEDEAALWSVVGFVVLVSVIVHGMTASHVIAQVDRELGRPTPDPV